MVAIIREKTVIMEFQYYNNYKYGCSWEWSLFVAGSRYTVTIELGDDMFIRAVG